MRVFHLLRSMAMTTAFGLAAATAGAQGADAKPIRMIVPLPAGTATDLAARVLGQQMSAVLKQSVVIDNKPGANGAIGVADLMKSAPDGSTLLLGSNSPLATNAALVKNISYDPRKDFTHVAGFGETMHVLMVKPSFPAKNMQEFIAHAKQQKGSLNIGSSTTGVTVQIATLNKLAGLSLMPIPYKGIPATVTDVIGGSLDASMVDLANAMTHAKAGTLRPIAVTSLKRNPLVPDWPAISETLPGFDFPSWVALVGPAGMSKETTDKLNAAVGEAMQHPEVKSKLATIGMAPLVLTPAQYKSFTEAEVAKWVRLAKEANVQPE